MTKLTPDAVDDLVRDCLYREGENSDDAIKVEGIVRTFGFHPERVTANKVAIGELLSELPDEFRADAGGGWTFLNACNDRHGRLWTGEHRAMEALFCLGIASGQAKWQLPRDMWSSLPGGMPYVVITPA